MSSRIPPDLPGSRPAVSVYLQAGFTVLPAFLIWWFSYVFLIPKLEQIWNEAGLTHSSHPLVIGLMKSSFVLRDQLAIVLGGVGLLILLMELRWAAWPRYRTGIITALAVAFQTVILVGVTAIAVASVFAAPMLARTKVQKAGAEEAAKNIEAKAQPAPEPKNP